MDQKPEKRSLRQKLSFWWLSFRETLNPVKVALLCFWAVAIGGLLLYGAHRYGIAGMLNLERIAVDLRAYFLSVGAWAPVIFVIAYVIRTFALIPATLFNLTAGFVFGPFWGLVYDLIGVNLSAWVAYSVSRYIGRAWVVKVEDGHVKEFDQLLHRFGWKAVVIFHLLYLPFDVTNYTLGLSAVTWRQYVLGTFLGVIPGSVLFVYLGGIDLNFWLIGLIVLVVIGGAFVFNAGWFKRLLARGDR